MFVTRKRHERELNELKCSYERMLDEKDARHNDLVHALSGRVEDLKRLVFAPVNQEIPENQYQADKIITQNDLGPPDQQSEEIIREQNRIFSGSWDSEALQ